MLPVNHKSGPAHGKFRGGLEDLLRAADSKIVAPSGLYRPIPDRQGVLHTAEDGHRALARMVALGRVRVGMVLAGTLQSPGIQRLGLRVVAEREPPEYCFTCCRELPHSLSLRLATVLRGEDTETLRRVAPGEVPQPPLNTSRNSDGPPRP